MANDVASCIVKILKEDDDDFLKLFEQTKKRNSEIDILSIIKLMIKTAMMEDNCTNVCISKLCKKCHHCVKRESKDLDKEKYSVFLFLDYDDDDDYHKNNDKCYIVCETMKRVYDSDFVKQKDFRFIWRYHNYEYKLYLTWEHWNQ